MNIRLNLSRKIMFFLILLCATIAITFVTFKAEAKSNSQNEIGLEENRSISSQLDVNSVFTFTPISETECDVRLRDKTITKAIIPENVEINGKEYTVTVIAVNGFSMSSNLELVRIPKSVKTIGQNAFANCKALTSLTLQAVETIGANAFVNTNMEYLIIPKTVTSIASTILRNANTQVYVRAALEDGATAPEGWVSNWNGSNKNQAVEFDSKFIPEVKYDLVTSNIATFAEGDNTPMESYVVSAYQEFCTIDDNDYKEVYIPATYTGEDGIERSVVGIDSFAFDDNFIDKVTIGYADTPFNINSDAFFGLKSKVLTFNREIEFISEDWEGNMTDSELIFASSEVETIILPNNITKIVNNMFDGCLKLRDIHFVSPNPNLNRTAEMNLITKFYSTQIVDLPTTIISIGNDAFALTSNIKELKIPSSVEYVGKNIINGWTSDQTVNVDMFADDERIASWDNYWALGSSGEETAKIVFKLSDRSFSISYNIEKEYHMNPETYSSSKGLTLKPVIKAGYTFEGWYLDEKFQKPIDKIEIGTAGDLNLYAKLTANTYTIQYEKNRPINATEYVIGDMSNSSHTYDETSVLNENKYSLKGWNFKGWNTKVDGTGESFIDLASITNLLESGEIILYAQWEPITYEIEYVGNRPDNASSALTGNMTNEKYSYEEEVALKANEYELEGYTFVGWNTRADGSGVTYSNEAKVKNLTETKQLLYAQWKANEYVVTYNSNEPTATKFKVIGEMENSNHIYDLKSFLRINTYTLEGYTFVGWNTKTDGTGLSFSNGAEVKTLASNGTIELYAQWQAKTYSIVYEKNKPTHASNLVIGEAFSSTHKVDEASPLKSNEYELSGWTFIGWNTKTDGSGISYENKAIITNLITTEGTLYLYAQWQSNTYTINYMKNRPSNASNDVIGQEYSSTHKVDEASPLKLNEYKLLGWTFIGWNTKSDGSGTSYTNSYNIKLAPTQDTIILYAQWEPNTFNIVYKQNKPINASNEVSGETNGSLHTVDETSSLTANGFVLKGWTFIGWNTKADGSGISYANNQNIKLAINDASYVLYAQWRANTYKVKYMFNKPSQATKPKIDEMEASQLVVDQIRSLKNNAFAIEGWTFTGWNTKADGSGIRYENEHTGNLIYEDQGVVTLYAQWRANEYTVKYNKGQGKGEMNSTVHTYDTPSKIGNCSFTYAGRTLKEWNTKADGSGTSISKYGEINNLTTIDGATIMLYAIWEENDYYVDYLKNKPSNASHKVSGEMELSKHKVGQLKALSDNQFSLIGWTFTGWNTKADGSGTSYENLEKVIDLSLEQNEEVMLYAQWRANTYTINYNIILPNPNTGLTSDPLPSSTTHTYDTPSQINEFVTLVSWKMKCWRSYNGIALESKQMVKDLISTDGAVITLTSEWIEKDVHECLNSIGVYEIATINQLKGISTRYNYVYKLICDLDLGEWAGIPTFYGTLYVYDYKITYKNTNLGANESYGFIIRNYGNIVGGEFYPTIKQTSSTSTSVVAIGGAVAYNYGTLNSVYVMSSLKENQDYVSSGFVNIDIDARSSQCIIGGIAGYNYGEMSNCRNSASIAGSHIIGGIAGSNEPSAKIYASTNYGRIWFCSTTVDYNFAGGITGTNWNNSVMMHCNNIAEIRFAYRSSNNDNVVYLGSLTGWCHREGSTEYSHGIGKVVYDSIYEDYVVTIGDFGKISNNPRY